MRNIGTAFLHQGMYADARDNFEAVLRVKPDVTSAFNRLIAVFMVTKSVEQSECLKAAFRDMLSSPQLHGTGLNSSVLDECVPLHEQVRSSPGPSHCMSMHLNNSWAHDAAGFPNQQELTAGANSSKVDSSTLKTWRA